MSDETKKEPFDTRAQRINSIRRKLSQDRVKKLLQISEEIADASKTTGNESGLQKKYQAVSEEIDRLMIEEAKVQEWTMPRAQLLP